MLKTNKQAGLSAITIILIIAGALLVIAAGVYLSQVYKNSDEYLIGGQKDEHGCLIPAGYSWCEAKQKCLRVWEEPCETVATSSVTVLSPNGGETWEIGKTYEIKWNLNTSSTNSLNVVLFDNSGKEEIITSVSPGTKTYSWKIPAKLGSMTLAGDNYKIGVYEVLGSTNPVAGHYDLSDATFSIIPVDSAVWKIYRSTDYGFEVKYPPALKALENPKVPEAYKFSVSFENPLASQKTAGQKIVFNVTVFKDNTQLKDAFSSLTLDDKGKVMIGGYEAQKLFSPKGRAVAYTEATIYTIAAKNTSLIFYGPDFSEISQADQDKILANFKFIQ